MKSLITLFVSLTAFSVIFAQDLVQNGGFENDNHFEFWEASTTVSGASVEPVNTFSHSGFWSAEFKSGTTPVGGWTQLTQLLLTPINNIDYKLSFWIQDSVEAINLIGVYGLSPGGEVALGIDSLNNNSVIDPDSGRIKIVQNFFQNWIRINYFFNTGQGYTGYLLKLEEASSGTSLTLHLDDFSILQVPGQAFVQLTAPNGGEEWLVGTEQNITWTSTNVTNVNIDYSTNNGGLWSNIESSVPAAGGSYSWTVPNTVSTECLVRISDSNLPSRLDISDAVFTILPPITINSPNGGESWTSGTQHNITWTSYNITDVSIDYSTDNGSNWNTVIASTPGSGGTYNWTVPNTLSAQCLVRISDASNPLINDVSDATFSIVAPLNPVVTVTAPNGGESWIIGSTHQVKWTYQDINYVKIEYSTNNGTDWIVVIASRLAAFGNYNWVIPNTPSAQCLVRISDVDSAEINDISNSTFTIPDPVSVEDMKSGIPTEFELFQNYPNPFNPNTVIEFSLPEEVSNVNLSVYNSSGEKVSELVNSSMSAGNYRYNWNVQNLASGVYFYKLKTDKFVSIKKMLLLK